MKEDKDKMPEPQVPVKFERRSTERRAAKIANTKIAESTKILASNKIIATAGLDTPTPKPRAKNKNAANQKSPTQPKVPLLVFNPSAPIQKLIPLSSAAFHTPSPVSKPVVPSLKVSLSAASPQKPMPTLPAKRKSSSGSGNSTKNLGLIMECEDDELSPIQWATYKRAENEYLDVLRKLTRWKSRSDVEIVQIDANDAIPAPPRFLTVTEASRLPLPSHLLTNRHFSVLNEDRPASTTTRLVGNSAIRIASTSGNGLSLSQSRVLLTPRSSFIRTNGDARSQAAARAPVLDQQQQVVQIPSNSSFESNNVSVFVKFPELEIRLSPQKLVAHSVMLAKKEELDKTIKALLVGGPLSLEKWMLEKGLFGQTRYCLFHSNLQMKLMYMSCLNDDQRKSGYKWWCPTCAVMVPVSQGSFFSKWKQTHTEVLRLIYHWACNTDIIKVIQEYAYNAEFINSVYMALRSICNAQSIHWRLGGHNHSVEIAEMPLGVCQDIENVSVYCAYDRVSRLVILGASSAGSVNNKLSILFKTFVAKESTIVGDRTLIPHLPAHFRHSFISSPSVGMSPGANLNASSYLRDHVCSVLKDRARRMKLYVIQAILDELSWREKFGQNPHDAFSNILTQIKQAYVCSVVTTKGLNSLPITMASGLKVVDTPGNQQSAVTSVTTAPTSVTLSSPASQPSKATSLPSPASSPQLSLAEEPLSSSVEPEITIEVDEDSSDALPTAEVIIEEEQSNEEPPETSEKGSETPLPPSPPSSSSSSSITSQSVVIMTSAAPTTTTPMITTFTTATSSASTTFAAATTVSHTTVVSEPEKAVSENPSVKPITIYKGGAQVPNTTPIVIIKGSGGELTIVQGSLKKPKPVCQEIKVSEAVPLVGLPLDTYYYATMEGTEPINQKAEKRKYKFKCPACKKVVEDNVKVMKHLHGHIDDLKQLNLDLSDLTQCKYCFREFASPYAMQSHVEDVHVSEPVSPICRICNKEFIKKTELLRHMQSSHTSSEMPYTCFVCKYRTSFYRDAINHFQQVHGRTNKLQCHYCLQVFSVRFGHGIQEGVTYSFYRHLYKHQTKSHSRRCQNCCLTFLSLSELQQHRVTDHISFKNIKGVRPVTVENRSKAIMIDPDWIKKDSGKHTVETKNAVDVFASQKSIEFKCIECKTSLYRQNHFIQNMSCSLCSFITTCSRAFADHAINVHSVPPRAVPKPFRRLSSSVCCLCGFHTFFGDKMARHLSKCSRKWCYLEDDFSSSSIGDFNDELHDVLEHLASNAEKEINMGVSEVEPMEISQPEPASSSSDNDDKHNMLNVLGLMRVPSQKRNTYSRKNVYTAKASNRSKASDEARISNSENADATLLGECVQNQLKVTDENAIRRFVEWYDKEKSKLVNVHARTQWNYSTNMTAYNEEIMQLIVYSYSANEVIDKTSWRIGEVILTLLYADVIKLKATSGILVIYATYQIQGRLLLNHFMKLAFENASHFDWQNLKNESLRRQMKEITQLDNAVLSEKKLKMLLATEAKLLEIYNYAKICGMHNTHIFHCLDHGDVADIFALSSDESQLRLIWQQWHEHLGRQIKPYFKMYANLSNEKAIGNNFSDLAAYWQSLYEWPTMEEDVRNLWEQVKPLYVQLHAYVRKKLIDIYGSDMLSPTGLIPSHLLGDVLAYNWGGIDVPFKRIPLPNITGRMKKLNYTVKKIIEVAEDFFESLGFPPMPSTFWKKSLFEKPTDGRNLMCHATAWNFYDKKDYRMLICGEVTAEHLYTIHHEMGHLHYFMEFKDQPCSFQDAANPAFHEAIGDVILLSVMTPRHLHSIGLLEESDENYVGFRSSEVDINFLFMQALPTISALPMSYLIDLWRWDVFRGKYNENKWNEEWWKLREDIQGLAPPLPRSGQDFDAGIIFHVATFSPFLRYFLSELLKYQFHRALCLAAGQYDPNDPAKPLFKCDIYNSKEAGHLLREMLKLGSSKHWSYAMTIITRGKENKIDPSALLEYFQPLMEFLKKDNELTAERIGWGEEHPNEISGACVRFAFNCLFWSHVVMLNFFMKTLFT